MAGLARFYIIPVFSYRRCMAKLPWTCRYVCMLCHKSWTWRGKRAYHASVSCRGLSQLNSCSSSIVWQFMHKSEEVCPALGLHMTQLPTLAAAAVTLLLCESPVFHRWHSRKFVGRGNGLFGILLRGSGWYGITYSMLGPLSHGRPCLIVYLGLAMPRGSFVLATASGLRDLPVLTLTSREHKHNM